MKGAALAPFLRRIALFTLVATLAVVFDVWEGLRGSRDWRWGYAVPERVQEWLPALAAVLVYGLGCLWLMRRAGRPFWHTVSWGMLGSALLPFIFLLRWGDPLYLQFTRVVSPVTSGPHLVAALYSPDTVDHWLRAWAEQQEYFAKDDRIRHVALAPPGLPIVYYLTDRVLAHAPVFADPVAQVLRPLQCHTLAIARQSNAQLASALIGMLSPLWASLAIIPLFVWARRVTDEETTRWVVLLWALVPGVAMFTPTPNTVFPTLAVCCCALLWLGLERRAYGWVFAAGLVASVLTFLNFSLLPLLLFCGLLIWGYHVLIARPAGLVRAWRWPVAVGAVFALGLAMVWIAWAIYGGPSFWTILDTAMSAHLKLRRPYLPWLVLHIWDYGLFLGLPLMLLCLWAICQGIREFRTSRPLSPLSLVALAFGLTLLVLDLSGSARGETGRVWQFLFPVSLVLAVGTLRGLPTQHHRLLLTVQSGAGLGLVLFLPVIGTGLTRPPPQQPTVASPQIEVETNIRVGSRFRLTGFGGFRADPGRLVVDLRWQVDERSEQPYYLSIIPVSPEGSATPEGRVFQPFAGKYPVTCWPPNEVVTERVVIPWKGEIPKGDWWLRVSVEDVQTRLPVRLTLPGGTNDPQAVIGPFHVK